MSLEICRAALASHSANRPTIVAAELLGLGERARRQDRLQRAEAAFDPLPFDGESARAFGRLYAAELAHGRKARGSRALDLLIAATACAEGLPIYTRNPDDFVSVQQLVQVISCLTGAKQIIRPGSHGRKL
jgi:predicted nucleic acid-binding protein